MKGLARTLFALLLLWLSAGPGLSYTRPRWQIGSEILPSQWSQADFIHVWVNTDPPNNIVPGSEPFLAVRNMFERRANYTPLQFALWETSSPESIGLDGYNLVTFKDTPDNESAVFGFAAVCHFWWILIDDEPVLIESDVVFGNTYPHTTTGSGGIDIEGLGGHELIHLMSFDHSAVIGSTAFPTYFNEVPNERNFALDDRAGMNFLYPFADTPLITSSLSGTVAKNGDGVFGAHVVAQSVPDGTPTSDISVTDGQWRIDGLPPGGYRVYVEALDGPSFPSNTVFSGVYTSEPIDQAVQTRFVGGNSTPTTFQVTAGTETSVGLFDIPTTGSSLNLSGLGFQSTPTPWISATGINMLQGSSGYLTVHGPGVSLVPNNGLSVSGSGVSISSTGVVRGFYQGNPWMMNFFTVSPTAKPGVRTIFANDGTRIAALTGGLEIHPSLPYPNLLRNDELTTPGPIAASGVLPLDAYGPDFFPGTGEGLLRGDNGSQDDDDTYAPSIESGFLDPDVAVLADASRPLVLYQLDDPGRTLFLGKTEHGRLVVTYTPTP